MTSSPPCSSPWDFTGPGQGRTHDVAVLVAGGCTGWWDEHGQPAPWPEDFLDPDSSWHPAREEAPLTPTTDEQQF